MLFRAVALSLALMIGIGTIIPLATEYAEAGPKHTKRYKKKPRKYKKYSKGWWRQYHGRMKRKKALAARKRALRLQQLRLAELQKSGDAKDKAAVKPVGEPPTSAMLPSGQSAPKGWKASKLSSGEIQFQIDGSGGGANSRMFYFTEADGRIYSVATTSAAESAEKLAEESEKVIVSLPSRPRPVQQASLKQ